MSSRVSSFGSLSERVRASQPTKQERSAHVWVDSDRPGVLLSWQRADDGAWTAQVAFIEAIPKSASGKILRKDLRTT